MARYLTMLNGHTTPRLAYRAELPRLESQPWSSLSDFFPAKGEQPQLGAQIAKLLWRTHLQAASGHLESAKGEPLLPFIVDLKDKPYSASRPPYLRFAGAMISMQGLYDFMDGDGLFQERVTGRLPLTVEDGLNRFVNKSVHAAILKVDPKDRLAQNLPAPKPE